MPTESALHDVLQAARRQVDAAFAGRAEVDVALHAAREMLDAALAAHPDDARLLVALGAVACDQGRHDQARTLLRHALALGTQDRHAVFNLGVALLNLGRIAQARAAFGKAATMTASPHTWEAWFDPQAL
ncbi:tetratricopeptide repeat protein [Bacillus subtilis subsp. subtilis]|nr:tetratricopeptide repeat protein [Bacillus subtilis subsp. subtilis]